jgi:hypothetical protein
VWEVVSVADLKREYCRQCRDEGRTTVADFILWGALFARAAVGPRCYDHTAEWVDMARIDQWAVYDLRPVNEHLAMIASTGGGSR